MQLSLVQNDDLKLVAANLDDGLSDAVEVDMNQVEQSESNSNILYEATITDNQEGRDLDSGEAKTLNNVNGIVLWNDNEDEPIEFADNNFVEANIISLTKKYIVIPRNQSKPFDFFNCR